ncbi:MAG: hypothetical protein WC371_03605 [Parachlamydiales bacterium]|jgi:hypothetical protein
MTFIPPSLSPTVFSEFSDVSDGSSACASAGSRFSFLQSSPLSFQAAFRFSETASMPKASPLSPHARPFCPQKGEALLKDFHVSALPYLENPGHLLSDQILKIEKLFQKTFSIQYSRDPKGQYDKKESLGSFTLHEFQNRFALYLNSALAEFYPVLPSSASLLKDVRLIGSSANWVLVDTPFKDVDLSYYISLFPENPEEQRRFLEIVRQFFLTALASFTDQYRREAACSDQKRLLAVLRNEIFHYYLTNSKIVQDQENSWLIVGTGELDVKVVLKIKREYSSTNYGQQISLTPPYLFYALGGPWEEVKGHLERKELVIPHPEEISFVRLLYELKRHAPPAASVLVPFLQSYFSKSPNLSGFDYLLQEHLKADKPARSQDLLLILEALLKTEKTIEQSPDAAKVVARLLKEHLSPDELSALLFKAPPGFLKLLLDQLGPLDPQVNSRICQHLLEAGSEDTEAFELLEAFFQEEKLSLDFCSDTIRQLFKNGNSPQALRLIQQQLLVLKGPKAASFLLELLEPELPGFPELFNFLLENSFYLEEFAALDFFALRLDDPVFSSSKALSRLKSILENNLYRPKLLSALILEKAKTPRSAPELLKLLEKTPSLDLSLQELLVQKLQENLADLTFQEAQKINALIKSEKYPLALFQPFIPHLIRLMAKAALRTGFTNQELSSDIAESALEIFRQALLQNLLSKKTQEELTEEILGLWQKEHFNHLLEKSLSLLLHKKLSFSKQDPWFEKLLRSASLDNCEKLLSAWPAYSSAQEKQALLLLKRTAELYLKTEKRPPAILHLLIEKARLLLKGSQLHEFNLFLFGNWQMAEDDANYNREKQDLLKFLNSIADSLPQTTLSSFYFQIWRQELNSI